MTLRPNCEVSRKKYRYPNGRRFDYRHKQVPPCDRGVWWVVRYTIRVARRLPFPD